MESKIIIFTLFSLLLLGSSVLAAPNIVASNVMITANDVLDRIEASVRLTNVGDSMGGVSWILEMQVRPQGLGPLFIFPQDACDPNFPSNVHVKFNLGAGESQTAALSASVTPSKYDVYFVSRDKCWAESPQGNTPVSPYPSVAFMGTYAITSGAGDIIPPPPPPPSTLPNIQFIDLPQVSVDGNKITTRMRIKNIGGDMPKMWLIEMQPRPKGQLPLTIFPQNVCDANFPENVHQKFQLRAGEEDNIALSGTVRNGEYDIYLVSRDKCYAEPPIGNNPVQPYPATSFITSASVGAVPPPPPPPDDLNIFYIFMIGSLLIGIAIVLLRR